MYIAINYNDIDDLHWFLYGTAEDAKPLNYNLQQDFKQNSKTSAPSIYI